VLQKKKRQRGNKKNPNSPSISQRGILVKIKSISSGIELIKTHTINSNDSGDKDPTNKNLEKTHVVHTSIKRKRETQKMGLEILEIEESPRAMDVDEVIEEPNWSKQTLMETREIVEASVTQYPKIFEEESITLHHTAYHKTSEKFLIEKVNMKNKKVSEKWK
jgi:hypothetical protein